MRRPPAQAYNDTLKPAVAKDFRGGLNTFDSDLNLNSRFLTEGTNVYVDSGGRVRVRFGTSFFAGTGSVLDEIIAVTYYVNSLIAVGANGKIVSIDGAGNVTERWSTVIASALPGSPAGWSTGLTFVSFCQFAGDLIICNGVDKPLVMDSTFAVQYLADPGTGSNTNVPRAKLCTTHNSYLVLAVTPTDTTTLFIGNKGTAGTFVGDPAPNDAVNFNTATHVYQGLTDITGLGTFRDKLIVTYNETILAMTLGGYNDATTPEHVPVVDEVIDNYGSISHNTLVALGDDILFLDQVGISSIQRALITATLTPTRESQLVSLDLQTALAPLTLAQMQDNVFAVLDRIANHVLFFIPKSATIDSDTDNHVYVFAFDKSQKFRAMNYFEEMRYRSGCRSAEGRIFLTRGVNVYYYRNQYEPLYTDYSTPAEQPWDDGTLWDDGTGWFDTDTVFDGDPITFSWATPYSDMRAPERVKNSKYLSILAQGAGAITVEMFTDRFDTAQLSMAFTQTEFPSSSTAVSRPSNNDKLYAWPMKFTRAKLRVSGSTSSRLDFIALTLFYNGGSVRR